ncbi:Flp family type IVb pilin [Desulfitibacter alkalitolerans]|uniref:Flp family type IVb pilin n=1 Tax=Desulfitibacter alkalitolerans TaxID=264641 RepID=UPI00055001C7|nr:Flp family type IVb pilin [Desulfitibacter alkalitolerans]
MLNLVKKFWKEEDGQGLTEYGLILGLIAVVVVGLLATMGTQIRDVFQAIVDQLPAGGS